MNTKNHESETLVMDEPKVLHKTSYETEKEDLLNRLLDLGIKQCEEGKTIPHAVVMARIKEKYNLKF